MRNSSCMRLTHASLYGEHDCEDSTFDPTLQNTLKLCSALVSVTDSELDFLQIKNTTEGDISPRNAELRADLGFAWTDVAQMQV